MHLKVTPWLFYWAYVENSLLLVTAHWENYELKITKCLALPDLVQVVNQIINAFVACDKLAFVTLQKLIYHFFTTADHAAISSYAYYFDLQILLEKWLAALLENGQYHNQTTIE